MDNRECHDGIRQYRAIEGKARAGPLGHRNLMDKASFNGAEAHRALDYFSKEGFDGNFLPWPRHTDDRLRPDELNAANDD